MSFRPGKKDSHRWISSLELDVDAYVLEKGGWALFASARTPFSRADLGRIAEEFPHGAVTVAGGAVKTSDAARSAHLDPLWLVRSASPILCRESGDLFLLEFERVLNPGLFLDQAGNRGFLRGKAGKGQSLLNLFCYTSSFSICAARSSLKTTSVDVSARYLDWSKKNFRLNGLGVEEHLFVKADARAYLKKAVSKQQRFSWIILDPPTFSRSDGKVFQAQKHMPEMILQCLALWDGEGGILITTNDASWSSFGFEHCVREAVAGRGHHLRPIVLPQGFASGARRARCPLKGFWILGSSIV